MDRRRTDRRSREPWSLRTRLVVGAAYVLAVILVALELPLAHTLKQQNLTALQSTNIGFAGLLASQISDPVAQATNAATELPHPGLAISSPVTETVGQYRGLHLPPPRVLVIDASANHRVLHDSSGEAPVGTSLDLTGRPEFVSALGGTVYAQARYSATLGQDILIVAVPVVEGAASAGGTRVVGVLRLSEPLTEANRAIHRAWIGLALVGLAALLVGLALAWALASSVTRPVDRLEAVAEGLGMGDLATRAGEQGPAEVVHLARSFNRMAAALEATSEAQRDFVANASHQLRTPLTGLRLRLEAIQDEGGPQAEQATKAQTEVDRLSSLVDDLLALARASTKGHAAEPVPLAEAGRLAVERWSNTVARSGQTIDCVDGGAAVALASGEDVKNVLDNLIENAVRYCPAGTSIGIEIAGRANEATIAVSDTGPGIPAEDRPRIFDRFYRGSNGRRLGPGTGLGLAIVAQLAERWGGRVCVEDGKDGRGTRIEVTFPAAPTGGPPVAGATASRPGPAVP